MDIKAFKDIGHSSIPSTSIIGCRGVSARLGKASTQKHTFQMALRSLLQCGFQRAECATSRQAGLREKVAGCAVPGTA